MELQLFTERLRVTPFAADDLDIASETFTDPEVVKYAVGVMIPTRIRREMPIDRDDTDYTLVATFDDENIASRNVLEKSGLLDRGRGRCYGEDSPIYRITRDEWNALQRST